MADDTATAEDSPITFNVKASNDAKFTLTLPLSTTVSDLKEQLASSEYADTAAERQRLIYSGRVLKDNDTLATYKIKDGHTIHLVKSAASNQQQRAGAATESSSTSTPAGSSPNPAAAGSAGIPGVPTNLAAGTGNNPLAGLTGGRFAGFAGLPSAGLFGPDGGMGPPPDADQVASMLENPQVQSALHEALSNPEMIDMMIQQNPMLRDVPGAREMMQSEAFRRSMTDPAAIRQMAQLQRSLGGGGFGGGGLGGGVGGGGGGAFPAPGVTDTTPDENRGSQNNGGANTTGAAPPSNPFMPPSLGAGNPFAALFPGAGAGQTGASQPESGGTSGNAGGQPAQNPFSYLNPALFGGQGGQGGQGGFNPFSPEALEQLRQAMGGQMGEGGAANPFASLLGLPGLGSSAPQDNRPPEERYADQLRQLNDMGFFEFERNIEALRRSGGSVQGAVEYLLSLP